MSCPSIISSQLDKKPAAANAAILTWKMANEAYILSFELQRSIDSNFTPMLLMLAKGAIKKPNGYIYKDVSLPMGSYFYRLRIDHFSGQETYDSVLKLRLKNSDTLQIETTRL